MSQWSSLLTVKRFLKEVPLMPLYDVDYGIRTKKKHYLSFTVSKPILLVGMGIFGSMTSKKLPVIFGLYKNDICEPFNLRTLIDMKVEHIYFDGHRKVMPLRFSMPIVLEEHSPYILFLDVHSHNTYRGYCGSPKCTKDDVQFTFLDEFDPFSLSSADCGNFPELYFHNIIPETQTIKATFPKISCPEKPVEKMPPKTTVTCPM